MKIEPNDEFVTSNKKISGEVVVLGYNLVWLNFILRKVLISLF